MAPLTATLVLRDSSNGDRTKISVRTLAGVQSSDEVASFSRDAISTDCWDFSASPIVDHPDITQSTLAEDRVRRDTSQLLVVLKGWDWPVGSENILAMVEEFLTSSTVN